ncbi:MAG: NAD(+) synthase [Negativicutes bacterium]|nr:NAD(+) synthase [Negativicutes bacterium]
MQPQLVPASKLTIWKRCLFLRVALAQMEVVPGRPDINTQTMLRMIEEAKLSRADLIIFPEMAIPGYLLGDTWEQAAFLRDCEYHGRQVIAAAQGITIIFGNIGIDWHKTGDDGRVRKYNAFFIAQNGTLVKTDNFPYPFRIKTLHPNYREFDDTRHFVSSRKLAQEIGRPVEELLSPVSLTISGARLRIGCLLCEDGWSDDYSVKPITITAGYGDVDLFINISSSPFTLGKNNKRHRVFSKQVRETGIPLIYVNNVGVQNNGKTVYSFDGCSTVYNASGEIVACCDAFTEQLKVLDLRLGKDTAGPPIPVPDDTGIDTLYQALEYGTSRFLQSIGIQKVVIGASGGIDSALAAALFAKVLGPDNVLLVNMPSRFNSPTTKNLAAELAQNLGCRYAVASIQDVVDYTVRQLSEAAITQNGALCEPLTITPFITENIQARDRSARILAGMAAAFGGAFTCNANKSELTVGYSTLYGDQAGFFAALADLWKFQIYALGRYMNESVYGRQVIPAAIFDLVPSAELSPEQAVDEGKGDPIIYPYHDYLFRAFVESWHKVTPEEILDWYRQGILAAKIGCEEGLVERLFPNAAVFIQDLERWWKLYSGMAVAKRIQAPPVLALSRRAFGFDHREAQNGPYFTARYLQLKAMLLKEDQN